MLATLDRARVWFEDQGGTLDLVKLQGKEIGLFVRQPNVLQPKGRQERQARQEREQDIPYEVEEATFWPPQEEEDGINDPFADCS